MSGVIDGHVAILDLADAMALLEPGRLDALKLVRVSGHKHAVALLRGAEPRSVILAMEPAINGRFEQVSQLHAAVSDSVALVVVARQGDVDEDAARDAGATDVVVLPRDEAEVAEIVRLAIIKTTRPLLGVSAHIQRVRETIARVARTDVVVLVRGEPGTGKEIVARAIHAASKRAAGPFVDVNCAALPEALFEAEVFGYEKGAFTGATGAKPGRIDRAVGGTLFLDEIGDLSPAAQPKLLRFLQEGTYERLGSQKTLRASVRVVAATNRPIEHMVEAGTFRADLFSRINALPIWIAQIRSRREDIEPLARHFCEKYARAYQRPGLSLDDAALKLLRRQDWRGANVRDLEAVIKRLVLLQPGPTFGTEDVEACLHSVQVFPTQDTATPSSHGEPRAPDAPAAHLASHVREKERETILRALKQAGGNKTMAANMLGIGRTTLYKKLGELNISLYTNRR